MHELDILYMSYKQSNVLLNVMQSLGMTELWITGNAKKKIIVSGKIVENVVYFFQIKLSVNNHILFIHNKRLNIKSTIF